MGPEAACEGRDGTRRVSHECELSSMISFLHLFCKKTKNKKSILQRKERRG
jgi:phage-related protein